MIDPLSTGLVLDQFMGSSQGGGDVESLYQQMVQAAEAARQQAMMRNPGGNVPPIDYAGIREQAERIASGQGPSIEPQQMAQADQHMSQLGMEEMAPSEKLSPWQRIGTRHEGQEVPQEIAKQARWRALADTAGQAARGFGTGDLDQAIAAFAGGFGENLDERVGAGLERSRQAEQDAMQRLIREEQLRASRGTRARASRDQEMQETEFFQSQGGREAKQKAMVKMAEEIERLAPPGSSYAAQAQAMLGDPVLYEPLEKLLDEVLSLTEGADLATKAKVREAEAMYDTPGETFDRQLARERLETYNRPGGRDITPTSALNALEREIDRQYDQILQERGISPLEVDLGEYPADFDHGKVMMEAETRAREQLQRRMGDVRGMTGSGSPNTDSAMPDSSPVEVTEKELQGVRDSLRMRGVEETKAGLRARGVSETKIRELLRLATGG